MEPKARKLSKKKKSQEEMHKRPSSLGLLSSSSSSAEGAVADNTISSQQDQEDAEFLSDKNRDAAADLAAIRVALLRGGKNCSIALREFKTSAADPALKKALEIVEDYEV
jgi:hypothetical protein